MAGCVITTIQCTTVPVYTVATTQNIKNTQTQQKQPEQIGVKAKRGLAAAAQYTIHQWPIQWVPGLQYIPGR